MDQTLGVGEARRPRARGGRETQAVSRRVREKGAPGGNGDGSGGGWSTGQGMGCGEVGGAGGRGGRTGILSKMERRWGRRRG